MTPPWVMEPGRKVPVIRDVDVAVVGGGCAGVCAVVAAARQVLRRAAARRLPHDAKEPTRDWYVQLTKDAAKKAIKRIEPARHPTHPKRQGVEGAWQW